MGVAMKPMRKAYHPNCCWAMMASQISGEGHKKLGSSPYGSSSNEIFVVEGTDIVYPRMVRAPSWIGSKASVIPYEVEKAYVQYMILDGNLEKLSGWCFCQQCSRRSDVRAVPIAV